jgi:hypothetical protein
MHLLNSLPACLQHALAINELHSRLAEASAATASAEQRAAVAEAAADDLRQQLQAAEGRAHDWEQQAVVLQSQVPSWLPIPATILPLPLLEVVREQTKVWLAHVIWLM